MGAPAPPLPQQRSGLPLVLGTRSHNHCLVRGWGKGGKRGRRHFTLPSRDWRRAAFRRSCRPQPSGSPTLSETIFMPRWPEAGFVGRAEVHMTPLVLLPSHTVPGLIFRASHLMTEA